MKMSTMMTVLAGAACSVAMAQGQPFLINASGATLQQNLFRFPAGSNEFLDINGDGDAPEFAGTGNVAPFSPANPGYSGLPQSLAQFSSPFTGGRWIVQYRPVGSGNGIVELDTFGQVFATVPATYNNGGGVGTTVTNRLTTGDIDPFRVDGAGYVNTVNFIITPTNQPTQFTAEADSRNPAALPFGTNQTNDTARDVGAIRYDIATTDVPVFWFVLLNANSNSTDATWFRTPGDEGYGDNPLNPRDKATGAVITASGSANSNRLRTLRNTNLNTTAPNSSTMFDQPVFLTPIAPVANPGSGLQTVTVTDLRYSVLTGRMPNGANFMQITRDSGSGTRNGWNNALGTDPSHGRGENIGARTDDGLFDLAGPNFAPSNRGGQSRLEGSAINSRISIAYTGPERGIENGWLQTGRLELLNTINDVFGGTALTRPTINQVIEADANGFLLSSPASFATVGDPFNTNLTAGGQINPAGNPAMRNRHAAAFLVNLIRSIEAFQGASTPGDPRFFGTPGELSSVLYLPTAASKFVPDLSNPLLRTANPTFNPSLETLLEGPNSPSLLIDPGYGTFGLYTRNAGVFGRVPGRTTGVSYTDGATGGDNFYRAQNGTTFVYNSTLRSSRNGLAGDFDGNGVRNMADITDAGRALLNRAGYRTGEEISLELVGDFNSDGNFNALDVRYFADGLAIDTAAGNVDPVDRNLAVQSSGSTVPGARSDTAQSGKLNRRMGFMAADAADTTDGNIFDTVLARGTYAAGYSAADVAGGNQATPGFQPNGFDGRVDLLDVNYVVANFGNWADLNVAVNIDLSADMNGDLVIDATDADWIIETVLNSDRGDLDLDGDVDCDDYNLASIGGNRYSDGDVDFDGDVDNNDLASIARTICPADITGDAQVNIFDILAYFNAFGAGDLATADFNNDGALNIFDILAYFAAFGSCTGC